MKVLYCGQAAYRYLPSDFAQRYDSVVTTPYLDLVEGPKIYESLHSHVEELLLAARSGFDGVMVTEHSQTSYDLSPNPNLIASILAHTTQVEQLDTPITVLGRSLGKSREPLRIAEEYAMLDALSGGRLIAGLPVGLSYDANQNGGIPPIETRARYREGRALLEKAWSATEPFAWNGKYSRYPIVNIWPRPLQQPHPPFWIPGSGSPSTLSEILGHDEVFTYLSHFGPKLTGPRIFNRFWDMAEEMGRDRNPYRLAFMQVVCVGESDAEAERLYGEHMQTHFRNSFGSVPQSGFSLPGYTDIRGVEAILKDHGDMGIAGRLREISFRELVDTRAAIVGGPETVREQIAEFVKEFRIGNLLVMLHGGSMPHELARYNIGLFASEVLPHLQGIWDDEDWDHHWWPTGIGAQTPEGSAAAV